MASKSHGEKWRAKGFRPNHPVILIPGLCSSVLRVEQSPYEPWIGKNIWLDMSMIGLDKVLDGIPLFGRKKRKKSASSSSDSISISAPMAVHSVSSGSTNDVSVTHDMETGEEVKMANVDAAVRRRWISHIVMAEDKISDPPGIKVRAMKGLNGCSYLDQRLKAFSYIWGPFIETLQGVGYTDDNLKAATYDWRLPPNVLESRDGYFSELKSSIESMFTSNGKKKVVLIAHSLGTRVVTYFLRWAERTHGRAWASTYIYSWVAVGPLFLGAPKSVRATVSGERMGLDAFLYPEEGVLLSRAVGSSPWMFPSLPRAYGLSSFAQVRVERDKYEECSLHELMAFGECREAYDLYCKHYLEDPCHGDELENVAPPPVDRLLVIYGINLPTETIYFYRASEQSGRERVTALELDPEASVKNYKCNNGIGYETRKTRQPDGRSCSGDGTVPYASLSYCRKWDGTPGLELKVTEFEKGEHRDILKDKRFVNQMIEYLCYPPPPVLLPESFKDVKFDVRRISKVTLTRKGVEISNRRDSQSLKYLEISSLVLDATRSNRFIMKVEGSRGERLFQCDSAAELITDIQCRTRYVKSLLHSLTMSVKEERDEMGQTALHRAVAANDLSLVAQLLSQDPPADVNAVDRDGWTPLHHAISLPNLLLIFALLEREEIELNLVSRDGSSIVHYLARFSPSLLSCSKQEYEDTMDRLFEKLKAKGANMSFSNTNGETPLHQAIMRGLDYVVKWLLELGANVNAANISGDTPLHYAIQVQRLDIIEQLLAKGADKHICNKDGKTPLALARDTSINIFARLCNVSPAEAAKRMDGTVDEYGQTPLHKAAFDGRDDQVFQLLYQGADVNCLDRNGWTPLHNAANNRHLDVALLLLGASSINVNIQSKNGSTPLHYFVKIFPTDQEVKKIHSVWNKLLACHADINLCNNNQESPLHQAVLANNILAVSWLLKNGADVDIQSKRKDTPLHYSIRMRNEQITHILLDYNADTSIKSNSGTAEELAREVDPKLAELIASYSEPLSDDELDFGTRRGTGSSSTGSGRSKHGMRGTRRDIPRVTAMSISSSSTSSLSSSLSSDSVTTAVAAIREMREQFAQLQVKGTAIGGAVAVHLGATAHFECSTLLMRKSVSADHVTEALQDAERQRKEARAAIVEATRRKIPPDVLPVFEALCEAAAL